MCNLKENGGYLYEAVLSVNLQKSWIGKVMRQLPVSVNVLDTIPLGEDGVQDLVEVRLNGTTIDVLTDTIGKLDGVDFVKSTKIDQARVIMIVGTKDCWGCRAVVDSKCFLISATSDADGWVEWKLVMDEKKQLQQLVEGLEENDIETRLVMIAPVDDKESLTQRQETIIKTALERGYYDFPKRIGIRELARIFSISTASVSETLRRGQKKIIEQYFQTKKDL